MIKYYEILGLDHNASIADVEEKYQILVKEFDPNNHNDDLKDFFKSEQDKIKEAYLELSLILKNIDEDNVVGKEVDKLDIDSSNDILICYQTLMLSEDATLPEIIDKYNLLLDEFNPDHQSEDLRSFFKTEQEKVKEAYDTIVKHLSKQKSEEQIEEKVEEYLNEGVVDSELHDLGDYLGNDETKFCKFCGHMQYVTNSKCVNCNASLIYFKNIMKTGEVKRMFIAPFSFKGRIRRSEYVLSLLIFWVSLYLLFLISDELRLYDDWYSLFLIPSFWFYVSQGTKRCHDFGHSGFMQLIPYYNPFAIIFAAGNIGDNRYGANPSGLNYN